jgi:hypothetical protein
MPLNRAIGLIAGLTVLALLGAWTAVGLANEGVHLQLQIVRRADGRVLWQHPVQIGDAVALDYVHSSDHTPVHDLFRVTGQAAFVLTEERFDWYGSGLEFHPSANITFSGSQTRVGLERPFAQIPLRVGEVCRQVLTVHGTHLPLLCIAKGRESLCIRISRQPTEDR